MNLLQNIDLYCERLSPGLWAEPANALSNLAFFAAALWLWRRAEIRAARALQVLVALIALIGVCSGAFHLAGQIWAEILDVGSITLFILCFVVFFLREVFGLRWWLAALGAPGFILFGRLVVLPFAPGSFNGSVDYFPALFGLALMTLVLLQRRDRAAAMFRRRSRDISAVAELAQRRSGLVRSNSARHALALALP